MAVARMEYRGLADSSGPNELVGHHVFVVARLPGETQIRDMKFAVKEVCDWCDEYLSEYKRIHSPRINSFYVKSNNDALAFRLKWC